MSSLKGRLRWLIALVIAAVLLPLAIMGYHRTLQEVTELADGRLAQAARTVDTLRGTWQSRGTQTREATGPRRDAPIATVAVPGKDCKVEGAPCEPEVGFQIVDDTGRLSVQTSNLTTLPPPPFDRLGFQDIQVNGRHWRTYAMRSTDGRVLIRAAERRDSRAEITQTLRMEHGLSVLVALPLLAFLVGWAVQRGLRPLAALARTLSQRAPGSRAPIVLDHAPAELQPVLVALNQLVSRSEDALERERRFSADMAHELRTPLAGISAHLQNADMEKDGHACAASVAKARQGVAIMARRIDQLLALAKMEAGAATEEKSPVSLASIATEVIEELTPLMLRQHADVSLRHDLPADRYTVQGYEAALSALVRNLMENALRHIPSGGVIEITLGHIAQAVYLDVIDNGPGIPADRRDAVFARFHREPGVQSDGVGLGLSIVQRAAELHGASITLSDPPSGHGLQVRVLFSPTVRHSAA